MVDARSSELEISVNDREFAIKQSPSVLQSNREGGTTGAALWRACLLFAEWLGISQNALFKLNVLNSGSTVLELGSGISGLVPLTVGPRVKRMVATDQQYALKLLQENITTNLLPSKNKKQRPINNIDILPLDWESSDTPSFLRTHGLGVDAIFVCDCIFNYALIQPLVQTCTEMCKARLESQLVEGDRIGCSNLTVCVVAQQLRQPDVFEEWLRAFHANFRVWRVPDEMLTDGLKEGKGYAVHVGVLRYESV